MTPGTVAYLSPWWVEVISFSPKARRIRYRRLARQPGPILRMGAKAFQRKAKPA